MYKPTADLGAYFWSWEVTIRMPRVIPTRPVSVNIVYASWDRRIWSRVEEPEAERRKLCKKSMDNVPRQPPPPSSRALPFLREESCPGYSPPYVIQEDISPSLPIPLSDGFRHPVDRWTRLKNDSLQPRERHWLTLYEDSSYTPQEMSVCLIGSTS